MSTRKLGLYIHIPFCKTICGYCAFPAFAHKTEFIPQYLEALKQEITFRGKRFPQYHIDTLYIGGGTPSILKPEQFKQLFALLEKNFQLSDDVNIEIENNPESLTEKLIDQYKNLQVKRISVGIQSLSEKTLWRLARPHNAAQSLHTLKLLSQKKWSNFGCDLIIGLPYQTSESFIEDLKVLLDFCPTHFSTYFLSLDHPKTQYLLADCPNENEQVKMYLHADQLLKDKGFAHYEVSNYALPGFESQHNLKYWCRQEYLGLGLGGHSFIDESVFNNTENFDQYISDPVNSFEEYKLAEDEIRMDTIMLNLRTNRGIDLMQFAQKFSALENQKLLQKAKPYLHEGHLIEENGKLIATTRGFLILDRICEQLY